MTPKQRFILIYGVLGYGGGMFVLFNLIHILRLHTQGASMEGLWLWLLLNAVIWPVLGFGFASLLWARGRRPRK